MKPRQPDIRPKFKRAACWLMIAASSGIACQAWAGSLAVDQFDDWPRASDNELEQQRGGFQLPNGVNIDFSLEKVIYLNGVETFSTFFQLPENGFLLQNGARNLALDALATQLSSVIQNNLDNQLIRTVNEINIKISNLQNMDLTNSRIFTNFIAPNLH